MKDWKLYILNAFLIVIVGYHILPDFSLKKSDFEKVSGILSSAKIETVEDGRSKDMMFKNIVRKRLIIGLSDRHLHEFYVSDIFQDQWEILLKPNAIGKNIVLYLGKGQQREDPFRIELNNKVVYDTDIRYYRNLLIMLFTLILTIRNLYFYFKTEDVVDFTKSVQTVDNSFVGFVKRKALGLRDYFLN